jgi:hypothetical protein
VLHLPLSCSLLVCSSLRENNQADDDNFEMQPAKLAAPGQWDDEKEDKPVAESWDQEGPTEDEKRIEELEREGLHTAQREHTEHSQSTRARS